MKIRNRFTLGLTALVSAVALATLSTTTPASGASSPAPHAKRAGTLTTTPVFPFQIAFRGDTLHFTDGFNGTIHKITPSGEQLVASVPNGEIAGVEFSRDRTTMAFTSGSAAGSLLTLRRAGKPDVVANLGQYEDMKNPDHKTTYGVIAGGNACARDFLAKASELPATYQGIKDSHAYQVAALPGGAFAVAEAGGNDILRVSRTGRISTLAVLPRQPSTFTAQQAAALGAPDCVVGVTYAWEPVPTDVEVGKHGTLWVSTLTGGPEGPVLGARSKVYTVSPSGKITQVAKGLLGATNLAVARSGRVYVTELFNSRVARVLKGGKVITAIPLKGSPVSVEVHRGHVYVGMLGNVDQETGQVLASGKIYRF